MHGPPEKAMQLSLYDSVRRDGFAARAPFPSFVSSFCWPCPITGMLATLLCVQAALLAAQVAPGRQAQAQSKAPELQPGDREYTSVFVAYAPAEDSRCKQFLFISKQIYCRPVLAKDHSSELLFERDVVICLDWEGKAAPPPRDFCPVTEEKTQPIAWVLVRWHAGAREIEEKRIVTANQAYEQLSLAGQAQFEVLQGFLMYNPGKDPGETVGEILKTPLSVLTKAFAQPSKAGRSQMSDLLKKVATEAGIEALKQGLDFGKCQIEPEKDKVEWFLSMMAKSRSEPPPCDEKLWREARKYIDKGMSQEPGTRPIR